MLTLAAIPLVMAAFDAHACTGISLSSNDGSRIVARTVEWAATPMQCGFSVCPRGHQHQSYTPSGENGLKYVGIYGYVGIYTEYEPFVVEGVNESGLSAGLFFFPNYGEYAPYKESENSRTLCDMQFVSWVLSQFSSIAQVKEALKTVNLVTLDSKIGAQLRRLFVAGRAHECKALFALRPVVLYGGFVTAEMNTFRREELSYLTYNILIDFICLFTAGA